MMIDINKLFNLDPFALSESNKKELLLSHLNSLIKHHKAECEMYQKFIEFRGMNNQEFNHLQAIPFLPVRVFKELDLMSIDKKEIYKTLTSSGTSGQKVSKIYLDKETASFQTKALVRIMQSFMGKKRLPMMIVDTEKVITDRSSFSARGAAILGFSNFGKDHKYILDAEMNLKKKELLDFVKENHKQPFIIFGFTYIVWSFFYDAIVSEGLDIDLSNGILIHGGGWKKMQESSVDNDHFKSSFRESFGLTRVHNYYGMVEQVGSIYMECEEGYIHTPAYSDILIRDPYDWSIKENNETGVIELLSVLPVSYPGHAILSEDLGYIVDEEQCSCGRKGKRFRIIGRIPQSEPRGCGDTINQ